MICKVKLNKHQLDYFRRKARESKYEILAYLIGRVVSQRLTVVEKFEYTNDYEVQDSGHVKWKDNEYAKIKADAEADGLRVLGDIHTHPDWDAVLSPRDYKTHIEEGSRITGICSVIGNKTRVRFWLAESSLPCEIEYIDGVRNKKQNIERDANPEMVTDKDF